MQSLTRLICTLLTLALVLSCAGCGGGGGSSISTAQTPQQNNTPTGTPVQGSTNITCISDTGVGISFLNVGVASAPIKALVPNASGGYDTYTGTWGSSGDTFTIANVPAGPYWLVGTNLNLWTSSRNIDLGYRMWGGCKREAPSRAGTSLAISASGLNPWQYYDYFQFVVPNARTGTGPNPLPTVGDTSTSVTIPFGNLLLLSAGNGDNAYVAQLVTDVYGGIPFHSLGNFWGPQPITIQDGQTNSLNPVLQPVAQTKVFRANIRGSAFTAMYNDMFPGATEGSPGYNLTLQVTPDGSAPDSLGVYLIETSYSFAADIDAGDVKYANPYPSTWTEFYDYYDYAFRSLNVPGANAPLRIPLLTEVKSNVLPSATSPIVPLVGPALAPKINGTSVFNDQTISGTTPTISWQTPSVGTASGYSILIWEVTVTNGVAQLQYKTTVFTASTSVTLPPGILTSGKPYYFEIASLYRKDTDVSVTPYRQTFPSGETHLGSGLITVQ